MTPENKDKYPTILGHFFKASFSFHQYKTIKTIQTKLNIDLLLSRTRKLTEFLLPSAETCRCHRGADGQKVLRSAPQAGSAPSLRRQGAWPCMPRHQPKTNKHIFLPSCPCSRPSYETPHRRPRSCRPRRITSEDESAEVGVLDGSLHPAPASHSIPIQASRCPVPACSGHISNYLDLCLACVIFTPPTPAASLVSSVPFWLAAHTFPDVQLLYLPPPPRAAAWLSYP